MTTIDAYISTPGEILREEFLDPLGISQYRLAKAIHKPASAISEIINGKRSITPEMSYLIGKALGVSESYFLNLETIYQMKTLNLDSLPDVLLISR